VVQAFDLALQKYAPLHIQYRIILNDSSERNIQLITKWNFNEKGERVLIGIMQDITEQLKQEYALQQSNAEMEFQQKVLSFTEQSIQSGSWQINLLTRKTTYSDNCYRIFGLKRQPNTEGSMLFNKLVHPDDKIMVEEAYRRMILEHMPPEIEYRIIKENGKISYLRQKGKLMVFGDSDIYITGLIKDITQEHGLKEAVQLQKRSAAINDFALRVFGEFSGMAYWSWHIETGEINWSESFYCLLGFKPNTIALSQKLLLNYIHPDDRSKFTEEFTSSFSNKAGTELELRLIRRGETRNTKVFFRIFEFDGETHFISFFQDITKESQLLKDVHDKDRFTLLLSDAMNDKLMVTDINYRIVEWNIRCEEAFGKLKEEVLYQNLFDVFPGLKTEEAFTEFRKVLMGEIVSVERRFPGSKATWSIYMAPMKDNDEEIIGIIHILRDITIESDLKRELNERLNFIERLIESSVDVIVVLNKHMNFLYWNKKAEKYYGLNKGQVIGKNIMEVFPGMDQIPSHSQFRNVLKGETIHIPIEKSVLKNRHQESILIPIADDTKDITAVLWVMRDVTATVELNLQQQKADIILNTLEEGFYELDEELRFHYINKKCETLLGVTKEELLEKNIWEIFPQAIDSPLYFAIQYVMQERAIVRKDFISPITNSLITTTMVPSAKGVIVFFREIN
jgi:PAS domain S-box-containing protein